MLFAFQKLAKFPSIQFRCISTTLHEIWKFRYTYYVRRRESFYNMSDAMLVKSAFSGIKGDWFLHVNLIPITAGVKDQECAMNGLSTQKDLIQTSISNIHGTETLPDSVLQKQARQGNSLLLNASNLQTQDLVVSSNDKLVSDDKNVADNKTKMDEKEDNHGDVAAGAQEDVPAVATSKEKSRKRSGVSQNDPLPVEKKKRKKEKDQSLKEPDEDQVTGHEVESGNQSEELPQLKEVVPNQKSSEGFPSKISHVDSVQQTHVDVKKKRKKKKHVSESDEAARDDLVDKSLNKADAALGKQAAEDNHVQVDKDLPANLHHSRKKARAGQENSSKHDALDSSGKPVNGENGASENSHDKLNKFSAIGIEEENLGNEDPSKISAKSSLQRRKKKSEMANAQPNTHETQYKASNTQALEASIAVEATVPSNLNDKKSKHNKKRLEKIEKVTKEKPRECLKGDHIQHEGEKPEADGFRAVAVVANPATIDSTIVLNPGDKKSKLSRRKTEKTEYARKESFKSKATDSSVKETSKEIREDTTETNLREAADIIINLRDASGEQKKRG
ncbi:uncharacterized protein LOC109822947 isoform X2 [Asparagus officinalis]|uniref:uncharacterized protein LOC109822947 isoform X2 n=1 Tax=Asparagus officinalis TaxID=4686 RepID=UPI00098E4CB2|nr:uncharacterized protein LOC109822947 isoform X2 [Asparagus officinalis]